MDFAVELKRYLKKRTHRNWKIIVHGNGWIDCKYGNNGIHVSELSLSKMGIAKTIEPICNNMAIFSYQ